MTRFEFPQNTSTTLRQDVVALDALPLSEAIRTRQLSCREVMQAYLEQIGHYNPRVNALVALRPAEELLAEADEHAGSHVPPNSRSPPDERASERGRRARAGGEVWLARFHRTQGSARQLASRLIRSVSKASRIALEYSCVMPLERLPTRLE